MTTPSWFPDELDHAGDEHLDRSYVAGYDAKAAFDPAPDVEWLRQHATGADGSVVDLGCGTGTFATAMAPHVARVTAVDVSPVMIEQVRTRVAEAGLTNVEVVQAGLLSYVHEGPPADAVYSRNVLHQLPDLWKAVALARLGQVLRPGGMLLLRDLVFSFEPDELSARVEPWFEHAATDPTAGFTAEDYRTHLREEHSTFSWLLEPMLARAGFDVHEVEHRPSGLYSRYVAVRRG